LRGLYPASAGRLLAIVHRMLDDCGAGTLQDTFITVDAGRAVPHCAPADGWLTAIARNRAIDVMSPPRDTRVERCRRAGAAA
jgi:DNA-directed RNA polymerase specialized sigma24 family protein